MAVYRFKITFEEYDEVSREIEIKATQTFEELHKAIHASIKFDGNYPSSFYISDDHWYKGHEITLMDGNMKDPSKTSLMSNSRLCNFIEDPHQKIYYTFNFASPWCFYIELVKILTDVDPKKVYPVCVRTVHEAPKQFGGAIIPALSDEDLDFVNEEQYDTSDEEEMDGMSEESEGEEETSEGEAMEELSEDELEDEGYKKEEY